MVERLDDARAELLALHLAEDGHVLDVPNQAEVPDTIYQSKTFFGTPLVT